MKKNFNVPLLDILGDIIKLELMPNGNVLIKLRNSAVSAKDVLAALGDDSSLSYSSVIALRKLLVSKIKQRSKASRSTQTLNEVIRSAGLEFGRQDRRDVQLGSGPKDIYYRAKWGVKNVPALRLKDLGKLLETDSNIISARMELLEDTRYNSMLTNDAGEAFVVRTTCKPTAIKFFKKDGRYESVQQSLQIPDCLL